MVYTAFFLKIINFFYYIAFSGKNADDMFEDIGHSSEARSRLKDFVIGTLSVSSKY